MTNEPEPKPSSDGPTDQPAHAPASPSTPTAEATEPAGPSWGAPPTVPPPAAPPGWAHPPTVPPPPGSLPRRRGPDRSRRWAGIVIAAVVIASAVGTGAFLWPLRDRGVSHPSEWDERVTDLVAFVEKERGHRFDHPVEIHFLDAAEYREASTGAEDELAEEEAADLERLTAMYRSIGFVSGDVDLGEALDTVVDIGTLAFYDPATREVSIRGTELTVDVRITLVHELTHALQDQRFDLGRLESLSSHEAGSLRFVAEGDADRIEERYIESLDPDEIRAYEEATDASLEEIVPTLDEKVPPLIQAAFQVPYIYGPALVNLADAIDGTDGVDRLFTRPPSEFAVYDPMNRDPELNPSEDQKVLEVKLPDGADSIGDGSFGPINWYLLLAAATEPKEAMAITDGIEADGYRVHEADGRVCLEARAEGADPNRLLGGLRSWIAAVPDHDASAELVDGVVILRSCDPGPDGAAGPEVPLEIVAIPAIRTYTYAELRAMGAPKNVAQCIVDGVVAEASVDELLYGENEAEMEQLGAAVTERCMR